MSWSLPIHIIPIRIIHILPNPDRNLGSTSVEVHIKQSCLYFWMVCLTHIFFVFQGDRLGICVTQFDPKLLERGLVCSPGALPTITAAIISIKKIGYFKGAISTKAKFHITIGHNTVMGKIALFGSEDLPADLPDSTSGFDFTREYRYQDDLIDGAAKGADDENAYKPKQQFALIELERPVTCPNNSLVIGSRLDTDIHSNTCRLAFHGKLLESISDPKYTETVLPKLKVFKNKTREGVAERTADDYTIIGRGLFKKESNIEVFVGLKVRLSSGETGTIEGGFGQSGKFKVRIPGE